MPKRGKWSRRQQHAVDRQHVNSGRRLDAIQRDPIQFELDRRSCNEKVRFGSKAEARIALKKTRTNTGDGHIYECVVCRDWHVTSMSRDHVRKIRGDE